MGDAQGQMGIFPHGFSYSGSHSPFVRRGLQLVLGGPAHDHLEAAPADVRHPRRSLGLLFSHRRWCAPSWSGSGAGRCTSSRSSWRRCRSSRPCRPAGWRCWPCSRSAPPASRFPRREWLGVGARRSRAGVPVRLPGGRLGDSNHGSWIAVAAWFLVSWSRWGCAVGPVAPLLAPGAGFGLAAGVTYAAADVGTKAAVHGGALILFALPVWACHGLAFVLIQFSFQRGRALATAGLSSFMTNALPIVGGPPDLPRDGAPGRARERFGSSPSAASCSAPPRWRAASRIPRPKPRTIRPPSEWESALTEISP